MSSIDTIKQSVISFRTDKETEKELDFLIEKFEKDTGIKITKAQYIRYLILQAIKEEKAKKGI